MRLSALAPFWSCACWPSVRCQALMLMPNGWFWNRQRWLSIQPKMPAVGLPVREESYERIRAMVSLPNGSMVVGGMFEQSVEFHGDVIGYSSDDSSFGIDFFLAWVDENGTWVDTKQETSWGLDGIDAMGRLSDGTILVAGTFCGMSKNYPCNMTLGTLEPLNKSADEHENGVFLAAMTPFGGWLWATSYSNTYQMSVIDLMVLSNDEIHLALLHRDSLASGEDLARAAFRKIPLPSSCSTRREITSA